MKSIGLLILGFVVFGTVSFYMAKLQSFQEVNKQCSPNLPPQPQKFFHPQIMTFLMFFGEFLCLGVYFLDKKLRPKKYESKQEFAKYNGKHRPVNWIYCVASLFDFTATSIQYLAFVFIDGSTFQVMRSCTLISTAISVRYFTKMKFKKNHIIGCALAFVGLIIAGASNFIPQNSRTDMNLIIGIPLMGLSIIFAGMMIGYEQRLFTLYYVEPLKMVGFEGLFGILYCFVGIAVMSFIKCTFGADYCVCDNGNQYLESPTAYFREIGENKILIFYAIFLIIAAGIFNAIGGYVTKIISGLGRSVLDSARAFSVWIIGIILTVSTDTTFQSTEGLVIGTKIFGFFIIVCAVLIFNQMVPKKCKRFLGIKPKSEQQIQDSLMSSHTD